ncbi:MAG: hypothetical protein R3286_02250 [Gammaproteobacteria bacterium]|nr:hypothetical protein [Gammaproteobacteria bacterium]
MPEYADIYVLGRERNEETVASFLGEFLPDRVESADEYEMPQHSRSPDRTFARAEEVIAHCCAHSHEPYAVYWRDARDGVDEHAMVFFLADGGVVFGFSTPAQDDGRVDTIARRLGMWFGTDRVIVTYEELPPDSAGAFEAVFDALPHGRAASCARATGETRAHRAAMSSDGTPGGGGSSDV